MKTKKIALSLYMTPSDNNKKNMVNIGYMVNNHDLGTVFESVCISQVDGITPVIAFDNEDSAPMAEDDRMSNGTAEGQESVNEEVNSTSQPLLSSSVVAGIVNTETSEASSTSDNGNSHGGARKSSSLTRFNVSDKGGIRNQNIRQTRVHINLNVGTLSNIGNNNQKGFYTEE